MRQRGTQKASSKGGLSPVHLDVTVKETAHTHATEARRPVLTKDPGTFTKTAHGLGHQTNAQLKTLGIT